jgi:hypothetical protein
MEIKNKTIIEFLRKHENDLLSEVASPLFKEQLELFNFDEEELTVINQLFGKLNGNNQLFILQELMGYSKDYSMLKYDQICKDLQMN